MCSGNGNDMSVAALPPPAETARRGDQGREVSPALRSHAAVGNRVQLGFKGAGPECRGWLQTRYRRRPCTRHVQGERFHFMPGLGFQPDAGEGANWSTFQSGLYLRGATIAKDQEAGVEGIPLPVLRPARRQVRHQNLGAHRTARRQRSTSSAGRGARGGSVPGLVCRRTRTASFTGLIRKRGFTRKGFHLRQGEGG